jgi:hypothetical protein
MAASSQPREESPPDETTCSGGDEIHAAHVRSFNESGSRAAGPKDYPTTQRLQHFLQPASYKGLCLGSQQQDHGHHMVGRDYRNIGNFDDVIYLRCGGVRLCPDIPRRALP